METSKTDTRFLITLALLILTLGVAILGFIYYKTERAIDGKLQERKIQALNSEISRSRDEQGRETARRLVLEMENRELEEFKSSAEPELARLAELAAKYKKDLRAAAAIAIVTRIDSIEVPAVITIDGKAPAGSDTAKTVEIKAPILDPEKWISGDVLARSVKGRATVKLSDLQLRNDLTVAFSREDYGFLNLKTRPVIDVKLLNPNSSTQNVRAYQEPENKPARAIWFGAGAIAVVVAEILLSIATP